MKHLITMCALFAFALCPLVSFGEDNIVLNPVEAVDDYGESLSIGEQVALEIAESQKILNAAASKEPPMQGYVFTRFTSSLDCAGQRFTDNSFLLLPDRTPYSIEGLPINTSTITKRPDDDGKTPISLLVWYDAKAAAAASKDRRTDE